MIDLGTHKLIAMATLDDRLGPLLSKTAGETFWRGFLLEDRATGKFSFRYRFQYEDKGNNWTEVTFIRTRASLEELMEEIRTKMSETLVGVATMMVQPLPIDSADIFEWHVIPEADREDSARTVIWLQMQDLINEPRFEKEVRP